MKPPSTRHRASSSRNGGAAGGGADGARESDDRGTATRLAAGVARQVVRRIPAADLDERDPDYIRERLPGLWLLASLYFRARVRGLERVPSEGPVLLVGNHSGGVVIPDTHVLTLAFTTYFGVERRFHQLAHNLVLSTPGLGWLRKFGTVAASHENADAALGSGATLLVYPGGDHETFRPSWQSGRIDFGGRRGYVDLALRHDVPIVPVVSIGGQETAFFLTRGEGLARRLGLDRLLRVKILPIYLGLPFGLHVGTLPYLPLPAQITVEFLAPIHPREEWGENPDPAKVDEAVTRRMQRALDRLSAERRLPLIG
jgi:1-acyl-sn-glycerol-3-phosphate acyltransferase